MNQLSSWWSSRPDSFVPIVEIGAGQGPASTDVNIFSIICFSNAAGMFANELYHTAMLLLLVHKPRSVKLPSRGTHMSLLWHLERICSIALSNMRRECCDPCVVASLVLAGRRNELLASMDRIGSQRGLRAASTPIQYIEVGQNMAEFKHIPPWVMPQCRWGQTVGQLSLHRGCLQG